MFATRCVREAAGGRGPASVFPVGLSSAAQSVWSSATSTRGTRICVCACGRACVCQVNQKGPKPDYGLRINVLSDDETELFKQGWLESINQFKSF